jgi:hypothetical protein
VRLLDAAGIRQALVLSLAYQYGNPNRPPAENEYGRDAVTRTRKPIHRSATNRSDIPIRRLWNVTCLLRDGQDAASPFSAYRRRDRHRLDDCPREISCVDRYQVVVF